MKNRQNITLLAVAVALAIFAMSCVDTDTNSTSGKTEIPVSEHPIAFGGSSVESTRGNVTTINTLDTMGLYAVYTYTTPLVDVNDVDQQELYMYNQMVVRQTDSSSEDGYSWTYSPIKYWPKDDDSKISFIAFAPYDRVNRKYNETSAEADEDGRALVFSHTLYTTADNNHDLLWANIVADRTYDASADNTVKLDFQHSMCRIDLAMRVLVTAVDIDGSYDGEQIWCNGVTLSGVHGSADIYFKDEQDLFTGEYSFTPSWVVDTSSIIDITATHGYTLIENNYDTTDSDAGIEFIAKVDYETENPADATYTNVMVDGQSIFVLPQDIPDDAELVVRLRYYGVYYEDEEDYSSVAYILDTNERVTNGSIVSGNGANQTTIYSAGDQYGDTIETETSITSDIIVSIKDDGTAATITLMQRTVDKVGIIYQTNGTKLANIFNATNGNEWEPGQYIQLNCTVDFTESDNYTIPMSVSATVLEWVDQYIDVDMPDEIIIYGDEGIITTTTSGRPNSTTTYTATFYSNYGGIEAANLSSDSFNITNLSVGSVSSSGIYPYTATLSSNTSGKITIKITRDDGTVVTAYLDVTAS